MSDENDGAAIRAVLARYARALNLSDVEGAVACYSGDGVFMAPGIPTARGSAALRSAYTAIFQTIALRVTFEIDEVVVTAPRSAYALTRSTGTQTTLASGRLDQESNREVFLLSKHTGEWLFDRYLFNQPT